MTSTCVRGEVYPASASFPENEGQPSDRKTEIQPLDRSDSPAAFAFENLVSNLLSSGGRAKQHIADEVLDRIRLDENTARRAAWAVWMILNSRKPGRLDDSIGILSRLGGNVVRDAILDAFVHRPPEVDQRWVGDYWYVLVRVVGLLARQEPDEFVRTAVSFFSRYPLPAIREAAVRALADLGDDRALDAIRRIAEEDSSSAVRQAAMEMIEETAV